MANRYLFLLLNQGHRYLLSFVKVPSFFNIVLIIVDLVVLPLDLSITIRVNLHYLHIVDIGTLHRLLLRVECLWLHARLRLTLLLLVLPALFLCLLLEQLLHQVLYGLVPCSLCFA